MNTILVVLIILAKFYSALTYGNPQSEEDFYRKCVNAIYRECTHRSEFTEEEIERARIYIQYRFYNIPNQAYRPVREPCKKLHVRKDFKCLTHKEKLELIDAIQVLYKNGELSRLSLWPHAAYWGQFHKIADSSAPHRWLVNEVEKALKRVNPRVNMPYWSPYEEYDQPELGIIWDYLGRAGNRQSDYCVTDGLFVNVKPCVKRKWINDTHLRWWNPIELYDVALQNGIGMRSTPHFDVHVAIGGTQGHMSLPNAPYDFSFHPYHDWVEMIHFKLQLQNDQQLISDTYNQGFAYDYEIDRLRPANIISDRLVYFNVTPLETFQNTFGEQCYIHDVVIEAINEITSNKRREMPFNYNQLPKDLLKKYFPNFYSGNYSQLFYTTHPVMNCNRQCKPIRYSQDFMDTIEGQQLVDRFKYLSLINLKDGFLSGSEYHNTFIDDMNKAGYCSPYIIS